MEIVKDVTVVATQRWALTIGVIGFIGLLLFVVPLVLCIIQDEDYSGIVLGIILACVLLVGVATVAPKVPTGEHVYTVTITDNTKYKELVDKGYTFSAPLYDGIPIYEITGDPLQ